MCLREEGDGDFNRVRDHKNVLKKIQKKLIILKLLINHNFEVEGYGNN